MQHGERHSELIRHVLGPASTSPAQALAWLNAALLREVEPLRFVAAHSGLGEELVYQRAAEWTGLAFSPFVPRDLPVAEPDVRCEAIADVSSVRANLYGRDVLFTCGGLLHLVQIKQRLAVNPDLARHVCVVPPRALRACLTDRSAAALMSEARTGLVRRWPYASSHLDVTKPLRWTFVGLLALLLTFAVVTPFYVQPVLVPLLAFFILAPALLRFFAALSSTLGEEPVYLNVVADEDLPTYTILIPLRDEANMVRQLAFAMKRLDYPAEKLEVKFVVEATSLPTLEAVYLELGDPRFELVIIPDGMPRTKPKAMNYALPLVRGDFVVVYDAEDIPDPDQLRRIANQFHAKPELDCIQAELVVENSGENWLTALFAAEYAGQFGLIMPALSRWHLPMPLGGTSNHFRTRSLREVGAWDSFNVTEDADLGVRLFRLRYKTGTSTSQTLEEAPVTIRTWLAQRRRWMKGWMQTFLVHNRYPRAFLRDGGWRNFLAFQAYVGGMIVSAPLHILFLGALVIKTALGWDLGLLPHNVWDWASLTILVLGYGTAFVISALGLARLGEKRLIPALLLLPFYWTLTSIATFHALYELMVNPHAWSKTPHGMTRHARGAGAFGRRAKP